MKTPKLQPRICQAPTWTLVKLQPLELRPYLIQGTNLEFRSTNSKDTNPIAFLFQGMLGYTSLLPKSSSLSPINLQLAVVFHATSLMTTLSSQKVWPLLFMSPKQNLQGYSMMTSTIHHGQQCLQECLQDQLLQYVFTASKYSQIVKLLLQIFKLCKKVFHKLPQELSAILDLQCDSTRPLINSSKASSRGLLQV